MNYQIFGSKSSIDYDVMFIVDEIPDNIDDAHSLIKSLEEKFEKEVSSDKKVNGNLAVIKNGFVAKVFKGTEDEVNNSMFLTYDLHQQSNPRQIFGLLKRDVWLKSVRIARFILSFYSRTELRPEIKSALRGDINEKIKVLEKLSISKTPLVGKKERDIDVYKVIAFQFAQIFSLYENKEIYTKEEAISSYPHLADFLERKEGNLGMLDMTLLLWLGIMKTKAKNETRLIEYKYEE